MGEMTQVVGMKRVVMIAAALGLSASAANAASVVNIGGTGVTGASYAASLSYDDATSWLQVSLKNTSAAALAGNVTAFVFNIAGNQHFEVLTPDPTDLDPTSSMNWWSLTSLKQLSDLEPASPYGSFEAGAGFDATQKKADFTGGGNGTDAEGLSPSETGLFRFFVKDVNTGLGAGSAISASSFISEPSTGGNQAATFLVRFQGLNTSINDGSDKVPGVHVAPLPASAWTGLAMLGAIGASKWLRARKA